MSSAYVMLSQLRGLEERLEGVKGSLQAGPDSRDVEPSLREDHDGILLRALAQRDGELASAVAQLEEQGEVRGAKVVVVYHIRRKSPTGC